MTLPLKPFSSIANRGSSPGAAFAFDGVGLGSVSFPESRLRLGVGLGEEEEEEEEEGGLARALLLPRPCVRVGSSWPFGSTSWPFGSTSGFAFLGFGGVGPGSVS